MGSHDVVEVFDAVPIGATVTIIAGKLPRSATLSSSNPSFFGPPPGTLRDPKRNRPGAPPTATPRRHNTRGAHRE
jgi:hypothetical protein